MTGTLVRFYAVAIVATGVLSVASRHVEPVAGAACAALIFVPFTWWVERMLK